MLRGRRSTFISVVIVMVAIIGGYYAVRALAGGANSELKASGTIEATTVNVSPELAGKVQGVLVDEGQSVKAGEVLFRLDDTLLKAQEQAAIAGLQVAQTAAQTAQAAYASVQAQYTTVETEARAASHATRLKDWTVRTPSYFDQQNWYFTQEEQLAAAQVEVQAAAQGITTAQEGVAGVVADLQNAEFVGAEKRLSEARLSYLVALQVLSEGQAVGGKVPPDQLPLNTPCVIYLGQRFCGRNYSTRIRISKNLPNNAELDYAAQDAYNAASTELSTAQQAYNHLLTSAQAQAVLRARAVLAIANERYQVAQERVSGLQTGEQSPQVAAAAAGLEQAKNAAQQAQDAVGQAQANLTLLEAQLAKLEVRSPMEGVILTRNIEPGEYVAPGAAALTMGNLQQLTITVYVPEDRYGQIHLGQAASVKVDSFAGVEFAAQVSNISDQAEFTPRNVQTVEGRSSTVYAIKLTVTDPQGKLKPGMPADVTFAQ